MNSSIRRQGQSDTTFHMLLCFSASSAVTWEKQSFDDACGSDVPSVSVPLSCTTSDQGSTVDLNVDSFIVKAGTINDACDATFRQLLHHAASLFVLGRNNRCERGPRRHPWKHHLLSFFYIGSDLINRRSIDAQEDSFTIEAGKR